MFLYIIWKTPYQKAVELTDEKMLYTFIIFPSQQQRFPKTRLSSEGHTLFFSFFCISLIRWKSEPLKHLVNGRNGTGPGWAWGWGVMEGIQTNVWLSCWRGQQRSWWEMLQQTWPLYQGSVKNTVQGSKNKNPKTKLKTKLNCNFASL